jgi:hypothetical protein
MKHAYTFLAVLLTSSTSAQLVNGSFEIGDAFSATAWSVPCQNAWIGSGMMGEGDRSLILPHGTTNGPCYTSKAFQLVPTVTNGSTWTLSGWCRIYPGASTLPLIGIGMGIKHSDGWWEYFTAPVMNTYEWTLLSVTNTFTLEPGDTAFVVCEAGVVSGAGFGGDAEFDGLATEDISTGLTNQQVDRFVWYPNPALDVLRVNLLEAPQQLILFDATGRSIQLPTFHQTGSTLEVDVSSVPPGLCVMLLKTVSGLRTLRFIKA